VSFFIHSGSLLVHSFDLSIVLVTGTGFLTDFGVFRERDRLELLIGYISIEFDFITPWNGD